MALDIPLAGVEVEQTYTKKVNTTTTRVKGVYFDFDNTEATAMVAFGDIVNGEFQEKKQEVWKLSGGYYQTKITEEAPKGVIAETLLQKVAGIVMEIQGGRKQELLESGEITIN